ncbi:amino acid/polyamine transporter [Catenaria anguillulae PL171]|uniref:Amino acid/polyamine transporter n=1 Tax=Catenaria anguillulae PL171 TaxID=765915 RepID=A0A1Y2HPS6_9FUNG|nr:amino acid/polyamine transporter [Catenaria anguillulae PL171]
MTGTSAPTTPAPHSHRFAKAPHLWALGVGAVISGDFFGWQSALIAGFNGLLVTLAITTLLFVLLSFSIAELSTTVVVTCAVIVTGIGSYINQLLGFSSTVGPLWWVLFYVIFVVLNVLGVELSFRIQLGTTLLSVILLLVFYAAAIPQISYEQWVVQQNWQWQGGLDGIIKGLSFTLWFYLGIEELPLAVEDTIEPEKNMPLGLLSSIVTLVILSFCTVVFNSMISPGAAQIALSTSPLLDGYKSVFGDNSTTAAFSWLLIVGLIASFHSFIYVCGRLLYAIARDGYLPSILTKTHASRDTAYVALISGSFIGLAIALLLHFIIGDARLGAVLINLALIGALVSYTFQLVAFIRLRIKEPHRHRPYRSPFGVAGAVICLGLCALALFSIIYSGVQSMDFLWSIIGGVVYFGLGAVYFFYSVKPRVHGVPKAIGEAEPASVESVTANANEAA